MTTEEETIIFDALYLMEKHTRAMMALVKYSGSEEGLNAYKDGFYRPCVKLQMALGPEAIERGRRRYEDIQKQADEFFKTEKP